MTSDASKTSQTGKTRPEEPTLRFADAAAFEAWLDEHHASASGAWVAFAKKHTGIPSISQPEAVEVALCYGWIDGVARRIDDDWWANRFTPRTRRSPWSKINRERVAALIAAGRMRPAGLAAVEAAKADGRWDEAYDSPSTATVPDDLQAALDADPAAAAAFASLNSQNRYAILHRLMTARKPETRQRRLEKFVAMLAAGDKLYP